MSRPGPPESSFNTNHGKPLLHANVFCMYKQLGPQVLELTSSILPIRDESGTSCCKKGGLKNVHCQFNDDFYSVDVSATFFNRFSTVGRHDGYLRLQNKTHH
jgi:hypothetical protein